MIEFPVAEEGTAKIGTEREKFLKEIRDKIIDNVKHASIEIEINKQIIKYLDNELGNV